MRHQLFSHNEYRQHVQDELLAPFPLAPPSPPCVAKNVELQLKKILVFSFLQIKENHFSETVQYK